MAWDGLMINCWGSWSTSTLARNCYARSQEKGIQHTSCRITTSTIRQLVCISASYTSNLSEMRGAKPVMENLMPNNSSELYFALCESCFWSATILRMDHDVVCTACTDSNVSLIPLAIEAQYRIKLGSSAGLELSFSRRSR